MSQVCPDEKLSSDPIQQALADVESDQWQVRVRAVRILASHVTDPTVASAMLAAILDGRDTGVTRAAAEGLVGNGGIDAMLVLSKAQYISAERNQWEQVQEIEEAFVPPSEPNVEQLRQLSSASDADVAGGAAAILRSLNIPM
jgi:hypothetical protein